MNKPRLWTRLVSDERGGTAIEYGLIASLVVIAAMAAIANLANTTTGMWNDVASNVSGNGSR